jgi:agmatine/peptidylarginine deiminase
MNEITWRLPAEWEPQAAVLIAWPHAGTDWAAQLAQVEASYVALAKAITRFQRLIIVVADTVLHQHVQAVLRQADVDPLRLTFVPLPYDDTWLRDSGPLTLTDDAGHFQWLDYRFTGWGGKFGAAQDDALITGLIDTGVFHRLEHRRIDWALEGGAIESDGAGTVLTTWRCLQQRHPRQSREEITAMLARGLQARRILGLEYGYLEGDDTDAHIDTLARFAPGGHIVYQACHDPADPHYEELARMGAELAALRTLQDQPYRLSPLPWAQPIFDQGRRLAASYANYLLINDAVLVPAYGDAADAEAAQVIAKAYPGRTAIQIPCRPLIGQNGSLHCITMQLPAGAA